MLDARAGDAHERAMDPEQLQQFAHRLADAARGETLHRWIGGVHADDKGGGEDFDPVTDADREAERVIRGMIEAHYPDHGIQGEEFPERPANGPLTWSLDPVDGTRSFTCGLPNWVTLIALLDDGRPRLGLIDAPCLNERYIGFGDTGLLISARGEEPLSVSGCTELGDARVSTTDPYLFTGAEREGWERVRAGARTSRYGHDGYGYARLAAGTIDLVIESCLKPHDYNALIPVVRAAGGTFGDWAGGEDFSGGKVIAAASPQLYEAAVLLMNGTG